MKNVVSRKLIIFLLVFFILILSSSAYFLSLLITVYGSLLLLVLTIWFLSSFITKVLVFPGSYFFWLRMIEASFSVEISSQSIAKFNKLIDFLNQLSENSEKIGGADTNLKISQKLLQNLCNNYEKMTKDNLVRPEQTHLYNLLTNFKKSLTGTMVKVNNECLVSIWEVLENPDSFSMISSNEGLGDCIKKCKKVIKYMDEKSNRSILRGGYVIGTLDYMRTDLFRRFRCENFWVTGFDNCKIDCVWVSGIASDDNSPVILFCNPNATYYEFSYFQTDWIELYVGAGINLVLWNYRGYGRSQGKPDLLKIQKDGEFIVEYLKKNKKFKKIGVHGESLGGSIATHIASQVDIDFLFADRTFSSLANTAKFNFGKIAEIIFKVVGPHDTMSAKDFLHSKCFKMLSCDCNDIMIHNLGSLKSGVAIEFFQGSQNFPFTDAEIFEVVAHMKKIQALGKFASVCKKDKKKHRKGHLESADRVINLMIYFQEIIENIDAGGEFFLDVIIDCSVLKLKIWLMVLGIWGSTPSIYSNDSDTVLCTSEKFNVARLELCDVIQEFSRSKHQDIQDILELFRYFEKFLLRVNTWIQSIQIDSTVTGGLLNLKCGHNGSFNSLERYLYELNLQKAGFY